MVDSFNYAFENGEMSISQKCGIISLVPKKEKDKKYLKNWKPIFLLNNDYKIVTKALALHLEKVLPTIINPNQTGYVKGRYMGKSIRINNYSPYITMQFCLSFSCFNNKLLPSK